MYWYWMSTLWKSFFYKYEMELFLSFFHFVHFYMLSLSPLFSSLFLIFPFLSFFHFLFLSSFFLSFFSFSFFLSFFIIFYFLIVFFIYKPNSRLDLLSCFWGKYFFISPFHLIACILLSTVRYILSLSHTNFFKLKPNLVIQNFRVHLNAILCMIVEHYCRALLFGKLPPDTDYLELFEKYSAWKSNSWTSIFQRNNSKNKFANRQKWRLNRPLSKCHHFCGAQFAMYFWT